MKITLPMLPAKMDLSNRDTRYEAKKVYRAWAASVVAVAPMFPEITEEYFADMVVAVEDASATEAVEDAYDVIAGYMNARDDMDKASVTYYRRDGYDSAEVMAAEVTSFEATVIQMVSRAAAVPEALTVMAGPIAAVRAAKEAAAKAAVEATLQKQKAAFLARRIQIADSKIAYHEQLQKEADARNTPDNGEDEDGSWFPAITSIGGKAGG
jgi:hypothetical protein